MTIPRECLKHEFLWELGVYLSPFLLPLANHLQHIFKWIKNRKLIHGYRHRIYTIPQPLDQCLSPNAFIPAM